MKTTIIMPTVRVPENLDSWVTQLDWEGTDEIIIAGNGISPHAEIVKYLDALTERTGVDTTYLHPDDERCTGTAINEFLPPNHHNRRNFALLEAMRRRPDVLVTIDDDNYPYRADWLRGVKTLLDPYQRSHRPVIESETGWWNAGQLCHPKVIHRGFPVSRWTEKAQVELINAPTVDPEIGVVASLWYGDPDINAAERMLLNPEVTNITGSVVLAKGTWCPFDSQSTSVLGMLADMMFMWPGVGRYDDIWSSYVMRAAMDVAGFAVTYGSPAVSQARNPHDLVKDLREEAHGYEFTERFTDHLRSEVAHLSVQPDAPVGVYEVFSRLMIGLVNADELGAALPGVTRDSLLAWLTDCDKVRSETGM